MTGVACESKPRSVVRSSIHPCQGNWLTTGHAVAYYDRAVQAFSAGIKCWHCMWFLMYYLFNDDHRCQVHLKMMIRL